MLLLCLSTLPFCPDRWKRSLTTTTPPWNRPSWSPVLASERKTPSAATLRASWSLTEPKGRRTTAWTARSCSPPAPKKSWPLTCPRWPLPSTLRFVRALGRSSSSASPRWHTTSGPVSRIQSSPSPGTRTPPERRPARGWAADQTIRHPEDETVTSWAAAGTATLPSLYRGELAARQEPRCYCDTLFYFRRQCHLVLPCCAVIGSCFLSLSEHGSVYFNQNPKPQSFPKPNQTVTKNQNYVDTISPYDTIWFEDDLSSVIKVNLFPEIWLSYGDNLRRFSVNVIRSVGHEASGWQCRQLMTDDLSLVIHRESVMWIWAVFVVVHRSLISSFNLSCRCSRRNLFGLSTVLEGTFLNLVLLEFVSYLVTCSYCHLLSFFAGGQNLIYLFFSMFFLFLIRWCSTEQQTWQTQERCYVRNKGKKHKNCFCYFIILMVNFRRGSWIIIVRSKNTTCVSVAASLSFMDSRYVPLWSNWVMCDT